MEFLRAACIVIDRFSLTLIRKLHPELSNSLLVLVEKISDRSKVISSSCPSGEISVTIGTTLGKARCQFSDLVAVKAEPDKEKQAVRSLTNKLLKLSPFVEQSENDQFYLDVTGLRRHYQSERELAEKIRAVVEKGGFRSGVGIASNKFVACTAARSVMPGSTVVDEGMEQQFLARLPVDLLPVSFEAVASLHDLGLRTIGSLAGYPANQFSHRFGSEGALLAQLASGQDVHSFVRLTPKSVVSKRMTFTDGVTHTMSLLRIAQRVITELFTEYLPASMGFNAVRFKFKLEDKKSIEFEVSLGRVTTEVQKIISQLEQKISSKQFSAAVIEMTVSVSEFAPLVDTQLTLKSVEISSPSECPLTKEQLLQFRISQPRFVSSHFPDQRESQHERSDLQDPGTQTPAFPAYSLRPLAGMRLFNPAVRTIVTSQNGLLHLIKYETQFLIVSSQKGPWEISTDWWRDRIDRIYYEVTTETFCSFLIFFDRRTSIWFLQAVFD